MKISESYSLQEAKKQSLFQEAQKCQFLQWQKVYVCKSSDDKYSFLKLNFIERIAYGILSFFKKGPLSGVSLEGKEFFSLNDVEETEQEASVKKQRSFLSRMMRTPSKLAKLSVSFLVG